MEKAEGIILKTIDYGEANAILRIYTREFGKISILARGAKKTRSPHRAVSQVLSHCQILFRIGTGLGTLYQGEVVHSFRVIKADILKIAYAAYLLELVDKLTEEKQKNFYLYDLLYKSLSHINDGVDPQVLTFIFEIKMLAIAGIEPILDRCGHCNQQSGNFAFSIKYGGLLCHRCWGLDDHRAPLSVPTARLLRLFQDVNIDQLGSISLKTETRNELKQLITLFYDQYSGLYLKSRRFLEQIENMPNML